MTLPSNNPFSLGRRFLQGTARKHYSEPEVFIVSTPDAETRGVSIFDTRVARTSDFPGKPLNWLKYYL